MLKHLIFIGTLFIDGVHLPQEAPLLYKEPSTTYYTKDIKYVITEFHEADVLLTLVRQYRYYLAIHLVLHLN